MASLETVCLPHLPDHPLYVCLYKEVKNAAFLRKQLLEGNSEFEYAFLDASTILCRNHVLAACFRAINDFLNNRLKSRNVHSEIVFSLSPNNNIAESFRRFGIGDDTHHILAIKVGGKDSVTADSVDRHLAENVEGQRTKFSDAALGEVSDIPKIRKIYKATAPALRKGATNGSANPSSGREDLESFVLGTMALKGS